MDDNMKYTHANLNDAYIDMGMWRIALGFKLYLMTFTFNPIGGSEETKKRIMIDEIERLYAKLLNYTFRHPAKVGALEKPLWIYAHDCPVPKGGGFNRDHLFNIVQNDGLHGHAIALQPPVSRMKKGLQTYVEDNQERIHGAGHAFFQVDVREVEKDPAYVIGYATKSLRRKRIDAGEMLVLPKAPSEITRYSAYERDLMRQDEETKRAARIKARAASSYS
ncbi:hypothetical protein N7E02_18360 [Aliirhizobium terrae]|uniref:hypothetical protein n=1 Tax=Terrirhizobium terrae TaxID=2926709 RepID=UPI002577DE22|nr:hypothetical protein [Rhizobium sp. CC-CFT758]WJH38900.1 hypothetical protein N7E02_18360 [Rhizobium sp. CC-CFT758]